jgi:regulatory protein
MFHVKHTKRDWNPDSLYAYGLRLLSYRGRSEREVAQRFRERGAEPDLAALVVERLRAGGLLDDQEFARAWVESRRRASPRGDRLLQQELARKGVARPEIESALSDESEPAALARAAAAKKARSLAGEPPPVFVRRLTDFLLRRGFEYDVVATVVREVAAARDEQ